MTRLRLLFICLLTLIIALAAAFWQLRQFANSPLPISQPTLFTLPPGGGRDALVRKLHHDNIITRPGWLRWLLRSDPRPGKLKAGTYRITPGMTIRDLLALLASGKEARFSIRFVEGSRLSDWLAQLRSAPLLQHRLEKDDAASVAKALQLPVDQLEGHFWPDTWQYTASTSDIALLQRAFRRMQSELENAWRHRADNLPYSTPRQLLIMASLIEKETARPDERPLIASVFINRLRLGMRLQTDPSVIYGMGSRYQGNISRRDLQTPTPWNTYTQSGLPPTPIAMPGKASLHAAAHPAKSDYLYFVADGKGGHTFSRTLAEHNNAVARYLNTRKTKANEQPDLNRPAPGDRR